VDRMSTTDAGFFFAEGENTPLHVGSVSVFAGPAPSYGDLVRLLLGKLPQVPRYRQRVRQVPLNLGRPLWVDDEHFQILYHVRHTAVPKPGSAEQLRNLAGRVLGQRLDMAKPLWEVWLVEGLADDRWAIISKVHHCMVDGVAGTDLLQLIFDVDPGATHPAPADFHPVPGPSTASVLAGGVQELVEQPARWLAGSLLHAVRDPVDLVRRGRAVGSALPGAARRISTPVPRSLNGPIGPHRRWAWVDTTFDEVKRVRRAHGGTINDVVLTAVAAGFRELAAARGELAEGMVVRAMVPVSVRRRDERGAMDNQISAVLVDLPIGEPDPIARLGAIRRQMDARKKLMGAVDARAILAMGDLVAPALMAAGTRAASRAGQPFMQVTATNVPGPRVPLYVLGRPMQELHAYVPINMGSRVSIGIYSYLGAVTFGINADFDAFPDVDVLAAGIEHGMQTLADPTVSPVRAAT
jgi:diacylglycerol O-acyltransferase / wax synthase